MRVSALERRVPLTGSVRGAVEVRPLRHPGEASRVATVQGYGIWLAESADGQICLVAEHEGSAGGNCRPRSALLTDQGLSLRVQVSDGRPVDVVIAVPDGCQKVSTGGLTARVLDGGVFHVRRAALLPSPRCA